MEFPRIRRCLRIPFFPFFVLSLWGFWAAGFAWNLALAQGEDYELGVIDSMRKVFLRNDIGAFRGRWQNTWDLSLAKNEYESFQIVVKASKDLKGVRVVPTQTSGFDVKAEPVGSVELTQHSMYHGGDPLGWYPDPILTFLDQVDIKAGEYQSFWITVYASKDVPAGSYPIRLRVEAANAASSEVLANVRVWNFVLPDKPSLPTALSWSGKPDIKEIYEGTPSWPEREKLPRYIFKDEVKMLVEQYRFWPDRIYGNSAAYLDELFEEYGFIDLSQFIRGPVHLSSDCHILQSDKKELGLSAESSDDEYIDAYIEEVRSRWSAVPEDMKRYYYIYMLDEVSWDKENQDDFNCYEESKYLVKRIHEGLPDIPILIASYNIGIPDRQDTEFLGYLMGLAGSSPDDWRGRWVQEHGGQAWPYTTGWGSTTTSWYIEDEPINSRVLLGPTAYKFRFDGFLYWEVGEWNYRQNPGPMSMVEGSYIRWDPMENKGNGISALFWPGPERIVPTIRLANFRDGMEDYEYYRIAECLSGESVGVPSDVVGERKEDRTGDPDLYYAERARVAGLIESYGGNFERCFGPFSPSHGDPDPPPPPPPPAPSPACDSGDFCDDFNDGDFHGWSVVDLSGRPYDWSVVDGSLRERSNSGDTIILSPHSSQSAVYSVSVRARSAAQANDLLGIVFAYEAPGDYLAFLWNDPTDHYGETSRRIVRVRGGKEEVLAEDRGVAMSADQWYKLEIRVSERGIRSLVDGAEVLEVPGVSPALEASGLRSLDNDQGVEYDDFLIVSSDGEGGSCSGDLNRDGAMDVLDVQLAVNAILEGNPDGLCADLNADEGVNVLDLQELLSRVLGM